MLFHGKAKVFDAYLQPPHTYQTTHLVSNIPLKQLYKMTVFPTRVAKHPTRLPHLGQVSI
jgi:hypothetical protein